MPRRPSTHVDSPAAVGERLRAARLAAGLSQRDLSFDGCTAAYVSRIEAGARTPSYQILREFATRLGVTADYLATGEDAALAPDSLVEAEIALRLGELDRAEEIYAALGESDGRAAARASAGLGRVALARDDAQAAVERLNDALESGALIPHEAAAAAEALGRGYCRAGQLDEALALFTRFLEQARERGDRFETARFSLLLATTYMESGSPARAAAALADALADAKELLDPALRASLYWSQSRFYGSEGKAELAADYAQLAGATLRSADHAGIAARALLLQAQLENDGDDGARALSLLDEAQCTLEAGGDPADQAAAAMQRARALALIGREHEAVSQMLDVVERLERSHSPAATAAYASAAAFFRLRGDEARALELYERAVDRSPAPSRHAAEALTAMAEIHEERGDADEALRLLKAALAARGSVSSYA